LGFGDFNSQTETRLKPALKSLAKKKKKKKKERFTNLGEVLDHLLQVLLALKS
jgi:hypothetical protein